MQTKSWALAAAFALALSGASAEPNNRPRIYYPRQVKRQVDNAPDEATKRQLLDGVLDPILGGGDGESTKPAETTKTKTVNDEPSSSKDGILLGPTGIVIPGLIGDDDDNASTTAKPGNGGKNNTATDEPATKPTSSEGGGLLDPVLSDVLGPGPSQTKSDDQSAKPTSTKGGLLDPVLSDVLGTGPSKTKTTEPTKTGTKTGTKTKEPKPTSSGGGLLDPLPTLISDILGPGESTTSKPKPEPTGNSTSTTSDDGNIITDILPSLTLFPPDSTTTTSNTKETGTSKPPLIPTDILPTISLPGDTTPSTSVPAPTDDPGNTTTPDVPPTPTTTPGVPTNTPEPLPPVNSTSESPEPVPTTPTVLPTSGKPTPEPSPEPTTPTVIPSSSESETPIEAPTTSEKPKPPVTSIEPTATLTNSDWMPTTIVADPTSFTYTRPTNEPTGTSSQPLPTDIPKIILSNDPDKPIPEGSTEIQIGFDYAMNYNHVAKNPIAAAQIFKYLPMALSFAGGFKMDKVMVSMLVPLDTREKWGYVTTIAKVYYPEALLDTLKMDLLQPNSGIYNNNNDLVNDLTSDINPNIDIFGNIRDGEDNNNDGSDNDDDGGSGGGDAIDSGDSGNSTAKQQATTAGIAVGAFGLSVMYGAAMFIVARRYKRKRQAHRRSSSVSGSEASSEMQYANNGSPAMMGGALLSQDMSNYGGAQANGGRDSHGSGNNSSARTANISAPVATENSLGWN